jgi:hypothetical protein
MKVMTLSEENSDRRLIVSGDKFANFTVFYCVDKCSESQFIALEVIMKISIDVALF